MLEGGRCRGGSVGRGRSSRGGGSVPTFSGLLRPPAGFQAFPTLATRGRVPHFTDAGWGAGARSLKGPGSWLIPSRAETRARSSTIHSLSMILRDPVHGLVSFEAEEES